MGSRIIPVFCGPTAVGKSMNAISLAESVDGEIITADTVQVYKGFDIGAAKPTEKERRGIAYHLMGEFDPKQGLIGYRQFTNLARNRIARIDQKSKLPILEGGSRLYLAALSRESRRILPNGEDFIFVGFTRDEEELFKRSELRIHMMLEAGLLQENKRLLEAGYGTTPAYKNGIGYKEVFAYLQGKLNFEDMVKEIVKNTQDLIKTQVDFISRLPNIRLLNLSESYKPFQIVNSIANLLEMEEPFTYDLASLHAHELIHGLSSLDFIARQGEILPNKNQFFNTHLFVSPYPLRYAQRISPRDDSEKIFAGDKLLLKLRPSRLPEDIRKKTNLAASDHRQYRFYWSQLPLSDIVEIQISSELQLSEEDIRRKILAYRQKYPMFEFRFEAPNAIRERNV